MLERRADARHARRTSGGELQIVSTPSGTDLFTAPAVWHRVDAPWLFAADNGGTAAWRFRNGRLHAGVAERHRRHEPGRRRRPALGLRPGRRPQRLRPASGKLVGTLASGGGHWNSPIVVDGRVALPEGNANDHATTRRARHLALALAGAAAAHLRRLRARAPRRRAPAATRSATRARASGGGSSRRCRRLRLSFASSSPMRSSRSSRTSKRRSESSWRSMRFILGTPSSLPASARRQRPSPSAAQDLVERADVSTRRAAPTWASATSASSRGASVKTPIRAPAACSRRSCAFVLCARAEMERAPGRRRTAGAAAASRRAARRGHGGRLAAVLGHVELDVGAPWRRPRASRARAAACRRARRRDRGRGPPSARC